MAENTNDKTFRQETRKAKIDPSEIMEDQNQPQQQQSSIKPHTEASLEDVLAAQRQAGVSVPDESPTPAVGGGNPKPKDGVQVSGKIPPGLQERLQQRVSEVNSGEGQSMQQNTPPQFQTPNVPPHQNVDVSSPIPGQLMTNDPHLNALLNAINTQNYEKVLLPSRGKFYHSEDQPTSGEVHIRPMTGQEETILSTARLMRQGRGIEMIFKNCILEKNINPEKLLSVDRTYLLIYLRGISYGNIYEVTVKCPECGHSFDNEIDLNLPVEYCPDSVGEDTLVKTLPKTKFTFKYQVMTGAHESEISEYRERKSKFSNSTDDSFLYKASVLITEIGNDQAKVTNKHGIQSLLSRLPAIDVNYIRNVINDLPFGVKTEVDVFCDSCGADFDIELPFEANFFFPKEKPENDQL